jgi:hypothetical protein
VFCTVCQRYEGTYIELDRCDGLPTREKHLLQPINNFNIHEQANVVFIPDAIYRQLMRYPIICDEISNDFIEVQREPTIIDTGSKLGYSNSILRSLTIILAVNLYRYNTNYNLMKEQP